ALAYPELFCGLILISVHPGISDVAEQHSRLQWEQQLFALLNSPSMVPLVDYFETLPVFDTQQSLPPEVLAAQRLTRLSHSPSNIRCALKALGLGHTPDLSHQLKALNVPTRIITGALDQKYTHIAHTLSAAHRAISHAVIPNAGHNTLLEAPEQTIEEILAFTRQQLGR
ncbi:MAG: hypothetical protein JXX14_20405, partial [Deltaproteobacteria bacterium]|nr:hypothetical protein [Deltaproteobacteria bacterium]